MIQMKETRNDFMGEERYDKVVAEANEVRMEYDLTGLSVAEKDLKAFAIADSRTFDSDEEKAIFLVNFLISDNKKFYKDYMACKKNANDIAALYEINATWIFRKVFEISKYENYIFKKEQPIENVDQVAEQIKGDETMENQNNQETQVIQTDEVVEATEPQVVKIIGSEQTSAEVIEETVPAAAVVETTEVVSEEVSETEVTTKEDTLQEEVKKETTTFISRFNQMVESNTSKDMAISRQDNVIEGQRNEIANLEEANKQLREDNTNKDEKIADQANAISEQESEIVKLQKQLKIYKDSHDELSAFIESQQKESVNILIK